MRASTAEPFCVIVDVTNMKNSGYFLKSLINAAGTFVYVAAVAWLFSSGEAIFGKQPGGFLGPLFMLLLLVVSASITGLLVLGKPIHLDLGGRRKEAIILLFATLAWLVLFLFIVVVVLLIA